MPIDLVSGTGFTNASYTYYLNGINPTNIIKNNYNDPIFVNSPIEGYYINSNDNVIACDGSRCYIYNDYEECNINKIGSINNNLELCGKYESNSGNEIKIDGTSNGKFMVEISRGMFPGNLEGSYLLNFSNNVITPIFNEDDVTTYYLVSDSLTLVSEINMKGTLYKCQGSEACVIENSEGSYPYSDINTVNKFTNISCNKINGKLECEPGVNKKTENEVYCLSKQENSYLYICNENCSHVDDNNTPCRKEIANIGYYIPYYDNQLIECTDFNKCNNDTSVKSGYYKSGILNQPLIQCTDLLNKKLCSYTQVNNGFYLSDINGFLLKCYDGICSLKNISDQYNNDESYVGYYMSGNDDGALITCKKSTNTIICSLISTPKEGWYVNGDPDKMETGNILIKCQSLSSSNYQISCSESRSLNEGYVINVASENKLINCITGKLEDINDGYYYINGENEKLMYCIKNNDIYGDLYECNNVSLDNTRSWFKINPYNPLIEIDDGEINDDDKKIIICTKYKVCSYYTVDQMKKGHYLNSDVLSKNKSYPLIYNDGIKFIVKVASSRGWYINADINAETNEKIIACKSRYSCEKRPIRDKQCSVYLNGEFTTFYENIKWCNGRNEISLPVDKNKNYNIYIQNNSDNLIPGLNIKENKNKAIFKLNVSSESILQITDEEGYSYDNSKLYFCNDKYYGKCEKVEIKPGLYFNYKNIENVIKCDSNQECQVIDYSEKIESNDKYKYNCSNSNIIYYEDDNGEGDVNNKYLKLCNGNSDSKSQTLSNININSIYALRANLENEFPGATSRYILVNVNKYSIKFKRDISEISSECPSESSINKNDLRYCLKNEKLYSYTNVFSPVIYKENLKINSLNKRVDDKIIYDYYTNDGFFIYQYCNCIEENQEYCICPEDGKKSLLK